MDKVKGFLEVGVNDQGEVVVNHPDLEPDENGVGHIVFSTGQARALAETLLKKADEADTNMNRKIPTNTPGLGPGRYDELCRSARRESQALATVLAVIGGNKGDGLSICSLSEGLIKVMPMTLRMVAEMIEKGDRNIQADS